MTKLLIKLFIKNPTDTDNIKVRSTYAMLSSITGIIMNILLFAGKLTVGIIANSVAIIADAFNNISDAGSSVITFIGFRLASKPVDLDHPQGHGRFEYISAFIVDVIIIVVGFELLTSSVQKIITPVTMTVSPVTFILLVAAIAVKLWLFFFYKRIANTVSSSAIKAASADSISDCVATALVLLTAVLSYFNILTNIPLDGIVGILVAVFILFTGLKAAKETIDLLLGSPPDKKFIAKIYDFVSNYPEVMGIHDIMVHDYGPGRQIVSFHAEVPSNCDINHAHEVIDQIERNMFDKFNCIVTIHFDPLSVDDEEVNAMKQLAEECAKSVDDAFTIHDFRITKGDCYTNFIFDLVVPHESKLSVQDAIAAVSEKIKEQNSNYYAVIQGEHPFV